jgi:hypothetical protein
LNVGDGFPESGDVLQDPAPPFTGRGPGRLPLTRASSAEQGKGVKRGKERRPDEGGQRAALG